MGCVSQCTVKRHKFSLYQKNGAQIYVRLKLSAPIGGIFLIINKRDQECGNDTNNFDSPISEHGNWKLYKNTNINNKIIFAQHFHAKKTGCNLFIYPLNGEKRVRHRYSQSGLLNEIRSVEQSAKKHSIFK